LARASTVALASSRSHQYNFDPQRKLMSTLDTGAGHDWLHTKGAPESVLPRCTSVLLKDGGQRPLEDTDRERATREVEPPWVSRRRC